MKSLLAVPSVNPGGLEAELMPHFGHCDVFTLVSVENGEVKDIRVLPNMPHNHGDCTAPVRYLAEQGVTAMLAGGMGRRPLMAFQEQGIDVFFAGISGSVNAAVTDFAQGKLPVFGDNGLCKGNCGHH